MALCLSHLPDLMSDDRHADEVHVAASRTLVEVSTESVSPHIHNILSLSRVGLSSNGLA